MPRLELAFGFSGMVESRSRQLVGKATKDGGQDSDVLPFQPFCDLQLRAAWPPHISKSNRANPNGPSRLGRG